VLQAHKELKDQQEQLAQQVSQDLQVPLVLLEHKVLLVILDQLVLQAQQELQVHRVYKALQAILVLQVPQGRKVFREI